MNKKTIYVLGAVVLLIVLAFLFKSLPFSINNQKSQLSQVASSLDQGQIAHYNLDEGSGNIANDSSGNGNTATLVSNPTWVGGKIGTGALSFNAANGVEAASVVSSPPTALTFSIWTKISTFVNNGGLLGKINGNQGFGIISQNSGGVNTVLCKLNSATAVSGSAINDSSWHLVTCVWDGSNLLIYIDGVQKSSVAATTYTNPATPFRLAKLNGYGLFNGVLDDVRIYNRALSASEVSILFTGDITPPPPDTTPPVISSINTSNIKTTSATITWTTDEKSDSQVSYGTSTDYGTDTPLDSTMTTSHSVSLSSLTPETTYHFIVKSKDASGNLATSSDQTFQTPAIPPPDTTPPVISAINVLNITPTSGVVTWSTDESSDSQVSYGTDNNYGTNSPISSDSSTSHSVSLSSLTPETIYHFVVKSRDGSGNLAVSDDQTFQTASLPPPDTTPPVISSINVSNITNTGATITWSTDESSDSQILYGLNTSYDQQSLLNSTMVTSHSISLSSLTTGTTYHFQIQSKDASGNLGTSTDQIFQTTSAAPPPPPRPLGVYTQGVLSPSGCPTGFTCNKFTVTCPGVNQNETGVIADQKPSVSPKGVVMFFSELNGSSWWSANAPATTPFMQSLRDQGYELVQIQWSHGWLMSPLAVQTGQEVLACRPATAIKWVHDNIYNPLNLHPATGKCGFCITGNSAGSAQVTYPIAAYGIDNIVDAAIPTSGPPLAALSKGCLLQPGYEFNVSNQQLIDLSYGYFTSSGGGSGNGPCVKHDLLFTNTWIANSVETGGVKYNYPTTRVHIIIGGLDDLKIKNHANDYYQVLLGQQQSMLTWQIVPNMGHGIQVSVDGLAALFNALTQ